jgi:hypothetical protein
MGRSNPLKREREGRTVNTFMLLSGLVAGLLIGDDGDARSWTFEGDEPGSIAKGFQGKVGRWEVVATPEGKVLAQKAENPDDTFNVALIAATSAKDLDLSVRLKPIAGKDDRGGGLVWRAKDAKNYYIARYNPLEDNFRVYKVVDGKRTMFQDAKAPRIDGWRSIRVVMKGDQIECFLDGVKLLDVRDATFPGAGAVGLWSKADAQTHFDDLTLKVGGAKGTVAR